MPTEGSTPTLHVCTACSISRHFTIHLLAYNIKMKNDKKLRCHTPSLPLSLAAWHIQYSTCVRDDIATEHRRVAGHLRRESE